MEALLSGTTENLWSFCRKSDGLLSRVSLEIGIRQLGLPGLDLSAPRSRGQETQG